MMQEVVEQLQAMVKSSVNGIHTAIPGSIVDFDPGTCLATVSPKMKYTKPDGSKINYPNVAGVPVCFPQGAGQKVSVTYPIKSGDGCLLIASEQSLDYWMYERETATDLRYDLTNSVALVGLFSKSSPEIQKACEENAVVIKADSTTITIKSDGVDIEGDVTIKGNLTVEGSISN